MIYANVEQADVDIQVSGAQDVAGNTQIAYTETAAFDIDTVAPTVTSVSVNDATITDADVAVDGFLVTVDFSEAMDTLVNPTITFNRIIKATQKKIRAEDTMKQKQYMKKFQEKSIPSF